MSDPAYHFPDELGKLQEGAPESPRHGFQGDRAPKGETAFVPAALTVAGCILPARSTLHVRVVAPLPDRVAYMSQWLRLTVTEAAEQVRLRDHRRAEFIETHFQRRPADVYQYDLLLNSSVLGEDLCAEL